MLLEAYAMAILHTNVSVVQRTVRLLAQSFETIGGGSVLPLPLSHAGMKSIVCPQRVPHVSNECATTLGNIRRPGIELEHASYHSSSGCRVSDTWQEFAPSWHCYSGAYR